MASFKEKLPIIIAMLCVIVHICLYFLVNVIDKKI